MTRKQMKRFADEIYKSSKEEKAHAEDRIMQLTNQIMALPDGINALLEIDALIASRIK